MKRPYFPELVDCLRNTLRDLEKDQNIQNPDMQKLKRNVLLLLSDLERKTAEKSKLPEKNKNTPNAAGKSAGNS